MSIRAMEPVRPEVRSLEPYVPGKPVEELERELQISGAIKLASNENPLGPSPLAIEAMAEAIRGVNRYPDGSSFYLREALSEFWGVPMDQIAVGSGSNDLIDILCRIHLGPEDEAVMSDPAFVMFAIAVRVAGGKLVRVRGRELFHDPEAMLGAVTERTRLVYFSNPDNPTGTMVSRRALDAYFDRVPDDWRKRLPIQYAAAVVETAGGIFKRQEPHWPEKVAACIEEARNVLSGKPDE